jgi:hypothetical protein
MILGMPIETFTLLHVVISLIGITSGLVVLGGMLAVKKLELWTIVFLTTTVLTSATGFLFPITAFTPALAVGTLSLALLAAALLALYVFRLAGVWRPIYVVTAIFALYLNVFVGVVQGFQKIAFLQSLAPTQSEPPFLITQAVVLGLFIVAGIVAVRRFRPQT